MAKKKKTTRTYKKPPKKPVKKPAGDIVFTESAIVISLSAAEKRKAKRCLAKNGRITFSVEEHSVTRLPQLLDNGKIID